MGWLRVIDGRIDRGNVDRLAFFARWMIPLLGSVGTERLVVDSKIGMGVDYYCVEYPSIPCFQSRAASAAAFTTANYSRSL